jgi:hypothetical protein
MQNVKRDMKKWGTIGLISSFLVILLSIITILVNHSTTYTISVMLMGFGALIASFVMREESAERPMLLLRFMSGFCLAAAIFSQAIFIRNQYFAMLLYGIIVVWLILLILYIWKKYR